MIILGLILVFLLGLSIINFISNKFSIIEKIGLSFLIGIGIETIFMVVLDIFKIRFTGTLLLLISAFFILILNIKVIKNSEDIISKIKKISIGKINYKKINLIWLFFFILICILIYASVSKSLYWPTNAYDNVAGYDLMGKVMAAEGKINNSLFEINNSPILGSSKRIIYPPLVSGGFAFAYLFGLETSKLMTSLFFVFFVFSFYSLLLKYSNKTNAIIMTFFTIITPEFFAFTSLSTTNIPFACYSSLGFISFYIWFDKKDIKYLFLSSILIALSSWVRSEGIVFVFIFSLILLYNLIKNKKWKYFLIFSIIGYSLFIVWNLYLKLNFVVEQSVFFPYPFWDYNKIHSIFIWMKNLYFSTNYYGIAFYVFFIFIILNFKNVIKEKDWKYLFMFFLVLIFYTFLFYQMDNSKMDSLNSMMRNSYRRGLFAFIPLLWFYISTNKFTTFIFKKLNV